MPEGIHPHRLQRPDGSHINITQLVPYQSRDIETYGQLYDNIIVGFKDVFTWIDGMVSDDFSSTLC